MRAILSKIIIVLFSVMLSDCLASEVSLPLPSDTQAVPSVGPVPVKGSISSDHTKKTSSDAKMQDWLSQPQATKTVKVISLEEALLIALRNNPEILSSQLTRVMDKYALIEAKRTAFYPVLESISSGVTYNKGDKPSYNNVTTSMSLNTLTGRGPALGVDETDDVKGKSTTTMSLTQPLLQGFGNQSADYLDYLNALDAEKIAIYSYKTEY